MKDDTILQLTDPAGISPDPLTEILRKGARDLLAQAARPSFAICWPGTRI